MSKLKKRQHYVWRNYLRAWSKDEKIWTYFKESNKIECPNLMGVAQERYFYELPYLNKKEIEFIHSFINKCSFPSLQDLQRDFLTIFSMPSLLRDLQFIDTDTVTKTINKYNINYKEDIYTLVKTLIPHIDVLNMSKIRNIIEENNDLFSCLLFFNKEFAEERIKEYQINAMEDIHCVIENWGQKFIQCRSFEAVKDLCQGKGYDLLNSLMFLCVQYFRTKKMKNSIKETSKKNDTIEHIEFNLLKKEYKQGDPIELELYYPLTPKYAFSVKLEQKQSNLLEYRMVGKDMVEQLNDEVIKNSFYYIFSSNKESLEMIKEA